MAQLVLGVAGAFVGGLIGGPVGASIGWALGAAIGTSFTSLPDVQGPRLSDLQVPASQFGTPIPWVLGTAIVTGQMTYARDIQESERTEDVGGKGGPSQEVTTYEYYGTFGVHLCRGPIGGVRRVWLNDRLVYDARESNTGAWQDPIITENAAEMAIYLGTEDQTPDVREVQDFGEYALAYRGVARLVFEALHLRPFGNTFPRVTVEVVKDDTGINPGEAFEHESGREGDASRNTYPGVFYDPVSGLIIVGAYNYDDSPHSLDFTAFDSAGVEQWNVAPGLDNGSRVFCSLSSDGRLFFASGTIQVGWVDTVAGTYATVLPASSLSCDGLGFCPDNETIWYATSSGTDRVLLYSAQPSYGLEGTIVLPGRPYGGVVWVPTTERMWVCGANAIWIYSSAGTLTDTITLATTSAFKTSVYDPDTDTVWISNGSTTWRINAVSLAVSSVSTAGARNITLVPGGGQALYVNDSQDLISIDTATAVQTTLAADVFASGSGQWHAYHATGQSLWMTRGSDTFDAGNVFRLLINRVQAQGVLLQDIVEMIAEGVGIQPPTIQAAALDDEVRGWILARPMPARAALEPLMAAYAFDLPEIDGEIVAVKRGGDAVRTIGYDELVAESAGGTNSIAFQSTREQEVALPADVELAYLDVEADYEVSVQRAKRLATSSLQTLRLEVPVIMDSAEAMERAAVIQSMAWMGRVSHRLTLTRQHMDIAPADVIELENEQGHARRMLVLRADYGRPGLVILETIDDDASIYTQDLPGVQWDYDGAGIVVVGPALLFLMDTVLLRDSDNGGGTDAGFYAAVNATTADYPGASIYRSYDNANWSGITNTPPSATGRATTALADGDCTTWDTVNTLTVRLDNPDDTLASSTDLAVLNGANSAALEGADGWEVIQFVNAADNGDGTWTLSRLLRGRRGSDYASAGHAINDRFVILRTATTRRLSLELGDINLTRYWQAVSFGLAVAPTGTAFACTANGLRPLSVKHVTGARDGSDNLTIEWVRRSRIGGEWTDGADIPLGEESEAYEVDIMDGSTVVRTLEVTDETATYSAADQTTDFGSAQSEVDVIIYQISATVGRGFPTAATV